MPQKRLPFADSVRANNPDLVQYLNDPEFDSVYPEELQELSDIHWTPVAVARTAAKFLVEGPATRVLDIGCGPGKFCAVGASSTAGHFTGVERRKHLVEAGQRMLGEYGLSRVRLIHSNITCVKFAEYDAFYLFNPFYEYLLHAPKIDSRAALNPRHFTDYTDCVGRKLAALPADTRLVTYWCDKDQIPDGYECVSSAFSGRLKMWVKTRPPGNLVTLGEATSNLVEA